MSDPVIGTTKPPQKKFAIFPVVASSGKFIFMKNYWLIKEYAQAASGKVMWSDVIFDNSGDAIDYYQATSKK